VEQREVLRHDGEHKPAKGPSRGAPARSRPPGRLRALLRHTAEGVGARIAERKLPALLELRVKRRLDAVPLRIQKVADQASLVLELVDDYGAGHYREIAWRSLAIAALALLYSVSPADVIPDFIPIIGTLDDTLVIALAMRLIRRDLEGYCRFKGYALDKYF